MFVLKCILLFNVFCTSTIIGLVISKKYSNRVYILKELKKALNIFKVKINYSNETIPEIFKEISVKTGGVTSRVFEDTVTNIVNENLNAGMAFERSVQLNLGELKNDDVECIKSLGRLLGSTDLEGQLNQINLVDSFLESQISDAVVDKKQNAKMYQKLGAIVGLILVIVLI